MCYILARHKTTSRRVVSLYPAGEWVGGIFLCPGHLLDDGEPCVNENAVPLWPLVASKFAHFEEIHISSTLTRAPILVSADPSDPTNNIPVNWANFIDVYEEYVYQYGSWEPQRMMGTWPSTRSVPSVIWPSRRSSLEQTVYTLILVTTVRAAWYVY